MKLLNCTECRDILALRKTPRRCLCGRSEGAYFDDGLWAWCAGPARVIGLRNQDYARSLVEEQIPYQTNYPWFVCAGHVEKGKPGANH